MGLLVSAWAEQPPAKSRGASAQAAAAERAVEIRSGTVTGTFIAVGKTAELAHAYVKKGPFLSEKEAFVVVLSDLPIEESILLEEYGLEAPASEGKLHAIEVTFDHGMQPTQGRAFHQAFSSTSKSSFFSTHFVPSHFDGVTLAGKLYVEKDSEDEEPWEYTATINVPVGSGPKATASAPGAGTVAGSLTVAGKTAQLKHVYAHLKENPHEKGKEKLVVLFSDVPLEESAWRWEEGLFSSAREGKLHAIWAEFDDVLKPNFAQIYHNGFETASASMNGMHRFVPSLYDGKTFAGKLYVEPDKFFDITWEYTATFNAPISPKAEAPTKADAGPPAELPPPEVDWNALSEQQKGPVKLVVEMIQAMRAKDKVALKKFMTEEEHAKLEGPFGELALDMMSVAFSVPIKIIKVEMEGNDSAVVHMLREGSPEVGKAKAIRVNGEWKSTK